MKIMVIVTMVLLCSTTNLSSQNSTLLKGRVVNVSTKKPLKGVSIQIKNTSLSSFTNLDGEFKIENIPKGNIIITIDFDEFSRQNIPILIVEGKNNLGTIFLEPIFKEIEIKDIIILSEGDLTENEDNNLDNVSGLFHAAKDSYLRAAAFNFSQAWYKIRGYDSKNGKVSINGIEMNKVNGGRPQWSNWGGLNDAFRNQEFSNGISASSSSFGDVLGVTNFSTRASDYRKVSKISLSSTNKNYKGRLMATYATGLNKNDWAFVLSASRRVANEGYLEGTSYNAWAGFLSVEKILDKNNSLNFTAIVAPNRRGKSSPNTQEVYDLKGYQYNSYWGNQNGDNRNSRIKEIVEPIVMVSHFLENESTTLKTSIAYQFGHSGNSRLGYYNSPNPDPTYWKKLPSSYLRFEDSLDYSNAYLAQQELLNNGQINWQELYQINVDNGNSLYYQYEDRSDDTQFSFNSNLTTKIGRSGIFNAGLSFTNVSSENYGHMLDLLSGNGFVDLDQYALGDAQQNDLNNPNRVVLTGDKFIYNYNIRAFVGTGFVQYQNTGRKIDYFAGIKFNTTNYQRKGLYKNGTYSDNSFGESEKLSFLNFGVKGGITYKFTGRHLLSLNTALISNAPTIRNSFSNVRVNNFVTPDLKSEKILSGDLTYVFRSPKIQTRVTGYYTKFQDAIETSFFFAEGLLGDQADFVNETITGVHKKNIGIELSLEYKITSTIKLLAVGGLGQFTYDNNPKLYLQSESFINENSNFGTSFLKNYKVSGTPQRAYSIGFEYRDPKYWWFQVNGNYLSNNYLDISPLLRTENFYLDADGVPFLDSETGVEVTQEQVNSLLTQEKFDAIFLVNLVGGKSWKVKKYYFGFFMGINNVLGELFKTGGFEQSRNANYQELKQDKILDKPIFGPKYWYGNNTSYYLNLYVRF